MQPVLQPVRHVHDAVLVHVDVVDAVSVGALGYLRDVAGDFIGLEGVGGVEDADAAVEEGGVDQVSDCRDRAPGRFS